MKNIVPQLHGTTTPPCPLHPLGLHCKVACVQLVVVKSWGADLAPPLEGHPNARRVPRLIFGVDAQTIVARRNRCDSAPFDILVEVGVNLNDEVAVAHRLRPRQHWPEHVQEKARDDALGGEVDGEGVLEGFVTLNKSRVQKATTHVFRALDHHARMPRRRGIVGLLKHVHELLPHRSLLCKHGAKGCGEVLLVGRRRAALLRYLELDGIGLRHAGAAYITTTCARNGR